MANQSVVHGFWIIILCISRLKAIENRASASTRGEANISFHGTANKRVKIT